MQQPKDKNLEPRTSNLEPAVNPAPNPDVINLLDYLEVIAKNWRMIVRTSFIAAVVSVVYSLCLSNIFTATSRILPPQQDSSGLMGMLMGGAAGGMGGMAADLLGRGTPADMQRCRTGPVAAPPGTGYRHHGRLAAGRVDVQGYAETLDKEHICLNVIML